MPEIIEVRLDVTRSSRIPKLGGTLIAISEALTLGGSGDQIRVTFETDRPSDLRGLGAIPRMASRIIGVSEIRVWNSNVAEKMDGLLGETGFGVCYASKNPLYDSPKVLMASGYRCDNIVPPKFDPELIVSGGEVLKQPHGRHSIVISGNFKINPTPNDLASSIFDARVWSRALMYCMKHFPDLNFFVVGSGTNALLQVLGPDSGVIDSRGDLESELSLIQCADGFLGTSTGPSTVAILGTKPYLILKSPEHHARETSELLRNDRFIGFSNERQIFARRIGDEKTLRQIMSNWMGEF